MEVSAPVLGFIIACSLVGVAISLPLMWFLHEVASSFVTVFKLLDDHHIRLERLESEEEDE